MITSTANHQIKTLIQLQKKAKLRKEQDVFLVEGIRMFEEVPADQMQKVYVSESFYQKEQELLSKGSYPLEIVEDKTFAAVSDTVTPQGVLCVVRRKSYKKEVLFQKEKPFLLLLENLQDPGNMGTIFRTAEGAGVDGIILTADCVDLYNPKTIRSTMGSIFRMPFLVTEDPLETIQEMKQQGIRTYAAHLKNSCDYDRPDYNTGTAFLIGNEGNGLTKATASQADQYIKIPMSGKVESLNAAMAAGILMYEVRRQRK